MPPLPLGAEEGGASTCGQVKGVRERAWELWLGWNPDPMPADIVGHAKRDDYGWWFGDSALASEPKGNAQAVNPVY
jgi:hypothetical protein